MPKSTLCGLSSQLALLPGLHLWGSVPWVESACSPPPPRQLEPFLPAELALLPPAGAAGEACGELRQAHRSRPSTVTSPSLPASLTFNRPGDTRLGAGRRAGSHTQSGRQRGRQRGQQASPPGGCQLADRRGASRDPQSPQGRLTAFLSPSFLPPFFLSLFPSPQYQGPNQGTQGPALAKQGLPH